MKQNQKRNRLRLRIALMIAILLAACVFPGAALAYTTDRYDIDVIVREDNSYQVKERINVNFDKQKRGIFRYIPVYDDEVRKTMKITDVDTGDVPHKTYEENSKFVILLGDEDTYVTGPQQYEISYLVRIYDDKNVESDVLYYDLLPTEWETPIGACEINMKLPKPVKKSEIEIYAAAYGSDTAHENVYWSYDENKNMLRITGTELPQGTGITVYIPLEEGYWVGQLNNDWARTAGLVTMFAVPVLIVLYWLRKGRDPKLVKTVEFYPPKGMTPAEVGYFYDGNIDSRDLGAMVVYMAQKGYLRIEEKHHKLRVYPLKDPDDLEKPFVSRMYHGIFGDAPLQTGADSSGQTMPQGIAQKGVNLGKYSSSLRSAWQAAGRMLETEYSGDNAPMEQGSKLRQIGGALILCVGHFLTFLFFALASRDSAVMGLEIITQVLLLVGISMAIKAKRLHTDGKKFRKGLRIFAAGALIALACFCTKVGIGWVGESAGLALLFCALIVISAICAVFMERRNQKYARELGQIFGLRNFIEKAELPKLNLLVEEDPSYFYNILPYAYVMGLTDKWIKQFENIAVPPADWYDAEDDLLGRLYWLEMMERIEELRTYTSYASSATSSSTGSSGDSGGTSYSSDGGGYSGGGYGGGGGGAW